MMPSMAHECGFGQSNQKQKDKDDKLPLTDYDFPRFSEYRHQGGQHVISAAAQRQTQVGTVCRDYAPLSLQ